MANNKLISQRFLYFSIFLILIVFFISISQNSVSYDGAIIKKTFEQKNFPQKYFGDAGQPVLFQLIPSLFLTIFGNSNWVYHLAPILFAIATIILFHNWTKQKSKENQEILFILLATLPWFLLSATQFLQMSYVAFFSFCAIYFAERFNKENNKRDLLIASIFTYLSMMAMIISVVVVITISLVLLLRKENKYEKIKNLIFYLSISVISTCATFFLHYLIDPLSIENLVVHTLNLGSTSSFSLGFMSLSILALWAGPLLILLLYSFLRSRKITIHHIYLAVCFLVFFILNSDPYRPFERYFAITIPSILIICYSSFSQIKIKTKSLLLFGAIFLAIYFLFAFIPNHSVLPLEPKATFVKETLLSFGFVQVPFSSNGGPLGFYVPGIVLFLGWALTFLFALLGLFAKNKFWNLILISNLIALNLVVLLFQGGLIGDISPEKASSDLLEKSRFVDLGPNILIYNNHGFGSYLSSENQIITLHHSSNLENLEGNYSLLVVDFPMINRKSDLWRFISLNCVPNFESYKYGVLEATYSCSADNGSLFHI